MSVIVQKTWSMKKGNRQKPVSQSKNYKRNCLTPVSYTVVPQDVLSHLIWRICHDWVSGEWAARSLMDYRTL